MNIDKNIKKDKIVVIGLSGESVFLTVDHMNKPEETVKAKSKSTEPGGKGYNQAITIGKLLGSVSFITALGNDSYRDECIKVLKENNVKPFIINKDVSSSYAVIITDKEGNNNVNVYGGASDLVTFEDIMIYKDVIDSSDYILLQLEFPIEVIEKIVEYSYKKNKKIIINPAPGRVLKESILKCIYLLTPNENEIEMLVNEDIGEIEKIVKLNKKGVKNIICTKGAKPITLCIDGKISFMENDIVKPVDTTGAGDVFTAALLTSLCRGNYFTDAIKYAQCASKLAIMKPGVVNSIPTDEQIKKEMR